MFKHGDKSTEVGKAPFLFTLASFLVTTLAAALLIVKAWGNMLAVFAAIMLVIVALASLGVLFGMMTDYAYIEDDTLFMSYMLKKSSLPIKEIGKVTLKDNVYHVCDLRSDEIGTINASALGIDSITKELYRKNVPFI